MPYHGKKRMTYYRALKIAKATYPHLPLERQKKIAMGIIKRRIKDDKK